MPRMRTIKPGFFTSEQLAECEPLARLLFEGLWCWADREGRLPDRPRRLKAHILPYDDCDGDALLTQLREQGLIIRYAVDGEQYIQITGFEAHQRPHPNEVPSVIPPPEESRSTSDQGMKEERPRYEASTTKVESDPPLTLTRTLTRTRTLTTRAIDTRTENDTRTRQSETDGTDAAPPPEPLAPVDEILRGLRLIDGATIRDDPASRERIQQGLDAYAELDASRITVAYAVWQNELPPKKRHRDVVRGLLKQFEMRRKQGDVYYLRDRPESGAWVSPDPEIVAPCATDEWRQIRAEMMVRMGGATYDLRFGHVVDRLRDNRLILAFPDEYEQEWAQRYSSVVEDAQAWCGLSFEIEYVVDGTGQRAPPERQLRDETAPYTVSLDG